MQPTHYDLLGVAHTATEAEIKNKYRQAARAHHPDVAEDKVCGARLFIQVNLAYRILKDAELRRQYDLSLQAAPEGVPPPPKAEPVDVLQAMQQAEHAYFQGRMQEARTLCAQVLKHDGRHASALALLGDALVGLNKPEEAAVAYRLCLKITQSLVVQAKLARLMQRQAQSVGAAPAASSPSAGTASAPKSGGLLKRLFDRPDAR